MQKTINLEGCLRRATLHARLARTRRRVGGFKQRLHSTLTQQSVLTRLWPKRRQTVAKVAAVVVVSDAIFSRALVSLICSL
jgi:hypothetical protein